MKILVVDDHPLVRAGISTTLSFEENIEKIIEASNINTAVHMIEEEKPDIAIIDLNLGDEDGLDIVKRLKDKSYITKFVILTSSSRREDYLRCEKENIDGYILKEAFAEDIIYSIQLIARGKKYIDPEIIKYQINENKNKLKYSSELTSRERDVLIELGNGLSNSKIAEKLFISESTVKKHVSSIFMKLDITDRTQAAILINKISNF